MIVIALASLGGVAWGAIAYLLRLSHLRLALSRIHRSIAAARPCGGTLARRASLNFTSILPSRHPPTHRTPTVSLATQAIGGFGLIGDGCHNPCSIHRRLLVQLGLHHRVEGFLLHSRLVTAVWCRRGDQTSLPTLSVMNKTERGNMVRWGRSVAARPTRRPVQPPCPDCAEQPHHIHESR